MRFLDRRTDLSLLLLHALDVVIAVLITELHDLLRGERFTALDSRVHLLDALLHRFDSELRAHLLDPTLILLLCFTRLQCKALIHVLEGHVVV